MCPAVRLLGMTFVLLLPAAVSASETAQPLDRISFDRQIRPVLSANCFGCHGPDATNRQADLRIDTKDGLFGDRGGYYAVVAGQPEQSELIRRITSTDPGERMPPEDSDTTLTSEEIRLLREWVDQGANWSEHWAFVAPTRPRPPDVRQHDWIRTPIDRFVLARLEAEGLAPSPEADRRTLIRRATLDLTGLPPRLEDVKAFVADASPDAYEKVIDRLLRSANYGEHRVRYWLDLARYADTHGLHLDNYREMWPFRDWVIGAFNQNLPYDQFLIEQLAGDLLPGSTLEQKVASGFIRNHVTTNEGGSIDEEVYVRNVVDCVSTLGTAVLGLTLGCAVCHDHKYDPITQTDFYQLFAFFNSLDGPSMDGNVKDPAPTVRVPTEAQQATLSKLRAEIKRLRKKRDEHLEANETPIAVLSDWVNELQSAGHPVATADTLDVVEGLVVHCKFDEGRGNRVKDTGRPKKPGRIVGEPRWVDGRIGGGFEITEENYVDLGKTGRFEADQAFSYGAWVRLPSGARGAVLAKTETKEGIRGYDLSVRADGRVSALLSGRWPGYAIKIVTQRSVLEPDSWHHLFVTYDGSRVVQGIALYVDGEPQEVNILSDSLKSEGDLDVGKPLLVGRRDASGVLVGGRIDDVRIYNRRLTDVDVQAVYLGSRLAAVLHLPHEAWTAELIGTFRRFYVNRRDPVFAELSGQIAELQTELAQKELEAPATLVYRERRSPRPAFLLVRGEYDQRGPRVQRATPAFLPPMPADWPRDRLGLARWLVSAEHPLTSRVAVNQLWQQLFGAGLVKTSEDFGSQGTPPTHPELLDWLAVEFRESGWDVKAMLRLIMMSATYRQSSARTPELVQRDPENRLLARGPRFRLDAEVLRDQALAVSGLLVNRIGGPSVKPPQPADLWYAVGYSGSNTVKFVADTGPNKIFRRSLYTFWKRTAPPPQMSIFDAPSREACIARRERTNTPLQALLLMNEPQYVESARHLAERILTEAPASLTARVEWAFEQVTSRRPTSQECKELLAALSDFKVEYNADVDAATKLVAAGEIPPDESLPPAELAAWTMLANVLLNLDEMITKE